MKFRNLGVSLRQMFSNKFTFNKKQLGITLPLTMLGMTVFLGAGSLAIDVSHQITAGVELQNAADASAIAGSTALDGTQGGITAAVDRALATTNTYEFGAPMGLVRADVRFAANLSEFETAANGQSEATAKTHAGAIRFIKVTVPLRNIRGVFTNVAIGKKFLSVTRSSIAGLSPYGLLPPAADVPEGTLPVLSNDTAVNTMCEWVPLSALQDPVNFAPLNVKNRCGNPYKFTPGCTYVIRAGSNGQNTGFVSGGNFQALAPIYPNGSTDQGGSDLRLNIATGIKFCIHPGDWIGTEPGENSGTVKQGLNARFGDYGGGLNSTQAPPDTNVKTGITYAQYRSATPGSFNFQSPTTGTGQPFRRVILIPIINNNEFNSGRDRVRLYDMGAFFLRTKVSNGSNADIEAEYIGSGYATSSVKYDPSFVPVTPSNGGKIRGLANALVYK